MLKNIKKNKTIIISLIIFMIISLLSIYSFKTYSPAKNLVIKQVIFYLIGFIIIITITKIKIETIIKYSLPIYLINIIMLALVLLIGKEINGTKAWFQIPILGSFQPSEFMNIGLILLGSKIIIKTEINSLKQEIKLILKLLIITIIPCILTFLEPDTGASIIYLVIFLSLIYASKIRNRWIILFISILLLIFGSILYLYFYKEDLLIKIFSSSLYYRIDRIIDFASKQGMQLENSIIAISSSGITGHGLQKIPIYYPEGNNDFIFTSLVSSFGLISSFILFITIIIFDLSILKKSNQYDYQNINRYITFSFISLIIFKQIENISMTIGLLPIMGITLPFISYGGSSLISLMILLGLVLKNDQEKEKRLVKMQIKTRTKK